VAERQYALDGRRSLVRLQNAMEHLENAFGVSGSDARIKEAQKNEERETAAKIRAERVSKGSRAMDITSARLDAYSEKRMKDGAARATINYELAVLRRAFRLAIEKGLLVTMPVIKLAHVRNARSGFFEEGDFAALLLELPAVLQPVIRFLRLTGWRRSEALTLTWEQVNWEAEVIRLAAASTKGGEARVFPFGLAPELKMLLEAQWKTRDGLFVFHRAGQAIKGSTLRCGWERTCKRAGLEGRLVHDLRRSAARDLRGAGVSEGEIMKLCGWRTRSMFDRYNIIDENDLARAVAKRFGKQAANNSPASDTPASLTSSST
jgi:integrase